MTAAARKPPAAPFTAADLRQKKSARLRWTVIAIGGAATALGAVALGVRNFTAAPSWSDLPPDWFSREVTLPPQAWRFPGAGPRLDIIAAAPADLTIIPEARDDITVDGAGAAVTRTGDAVTLRIGQGQARCGTKGAPAAIIVHTPLRAVVRAAGQIRGRVGPAQSASLDAGACSQWTLAGTSGPLWLSGEGNSQVATGPAGRARIALRGKAGVRATDLQGLDAALRGPARIETARLNGRLDATVWGRGRITVGPGFAAPARLFVKGPGAITLAGTAGDVIAEAKLGGQVTVQTLRGVASGAGNVTIGTP